MNTVEDSPAVAGIIEVKKKTILIYSPDLNFSFSLSTVFQDRYTVVTTTDPGLLQTFVKHHATDLIIVDAEPSTSMVTHIRRLKRQNVQTPILMLYVYTPKEVEMDGTVRRYVDGVLYKPFDVDTITERVQQLMLKVAAS